MNILMTGGTGFLGSSFIQHFSEHSYTVLTRHLARAKQKLPDSVQLIASLDSLTDLDNFDAVINLAGEPIIDKRWSEQQKTVIKDSRLNVTQQLVSLFANSKQPPKVFVSGSAIGIYGDRGGELLTESSPLTKAGFASELCLDWEQQANRAEPYCRVVTIRTGIVLAPSGGALAKMLLPFKLCLGGKIGNGQHYMAWIHLQDYLNALNFILHAKNLSGAVNMVAPTPVSNQEFTQTLAKTLKRIAVFPAPKGLLKLLLGESSCLLLDSQRVVPHRLLESGFTFQFESLKSALDEML